ncbi:hypothetical protein EYC84_010933 [Monilinia fructicola]|uniref:Uncharacterized protein n=1 Tax=Monilinia fructicola TaxID=38448 RepID=A0A5M9JC09_MONFR|nr:hypothetical protein EYC84_010933 [Monilinia fructicola]
MSDDDDGHVDGISRADGYIKRRAVQILIYNSIAPSTSTCNQPTNQLQSQYSPISSIPSQNVGRENPQPSNPTSIPPPAPPNPHSDPSPAAPPTRSAHPPPLKPPQTQTQNTNPPQQSGCPQIRQSKPRARRLARGRLLAGYSASSTGAIAKNDPARQEGAWNQNARVGEGVRGVAAGQRGAEARGAGAESGGPGSGGEGPAERFGERGQGSRRGEGGGCRGGAQGGCRRGGEGAEGCPA